MYKLGTLYRFYIIKVKVFFIYGSNSSNDILIMRRKKIVITIFLIFIIPHYSYKYTAAFLF